MQIFHFDARGIFTSEGAADPSPLEPGQFLLPARCTTIAPPAAPDGMIPRWDGSQWILSKIRIAPIQPDAVEKLALFLAANPDVATLIEAGNAPEE